MSSPGLRRPRVGAGPGFLDLPVDFRELCCVLGLLFREPLVLGGLEFGALGALVSGSGPTCAFLVESESAAVDLSVSLSAEGLCRAVRRATAPVLGARIIN